MRTLTVAARSSRRPTASSAKSVMRSGCIRLGSGNRAEFYVEAHHVMPVASQEAGALAASNVMTVCANHHRQIHYGGVSVNIGPVAFDLTIDERAISIPRYGPTATAAESEPAGLAGFRDDPSVGPGAFRPKPVRTDLIIRKLCSENPMRCKPPTRIQEAVQVLVSRAAGRCPLQAP
jgi:hypothetical protein